MITNTATATVTNTHL